jgi:hypothetical protein
MNNEHVKKLVESGNIFPDPGFEATEMIRCMYSFPYFCENYIKINSYLWGDNRYETSLVPFKLYPFQERLAKEYEENKFTIVSKYRQGGFTTTMAAYALWYCMYRLDKRFVFACKSDRPAIEISYITKRMIDELPEWLKPKMGVNNDHHREFKETGSSIHFFSITYMCSQAITDLVIDEAAFIPNMDQHWKALYPTINAFGKVMVLSTPNGIGNFFEETYSKAKDKTNEFKALDFDYHEHPDYTEDKIATIRNNLGERAFTQEFERAFLVAPKRKELLDDAMIVYNIGRSPERIEERWSSIIPDHDIWIPIRPKTSNTETLPRAQDLGV